MSSLGAPYDPQSLEEALNALRKLRGELARSTGHQSVGPFDWAVYKSLLLDVDAAIASLETERANPSYQA